MSNTRKKYNKKTKKHGKTVRGKTARTCNCTNCSNSCNSCNSCNNNINTAACNCNCSNCKNNRNSNNRNNRSAKMTEIFNRNKKRNRMIRNIRMGRSTFNRMYGGQTEERPFNRMYGGQTEERPGRPGQLGGHRQAVYPQLGGSSQFVGPPWSPFGNPNTGNFFAPSPNGVGGTGVVVPKLDDGQPLPPVNARFPTQLGPQMRGGNEAYKSRSRKHRGGGIISDFNSLVANVGYKFNDFNSELDGVNPPPNPNPYDQPIQKM
jgi:hypothetical protein